MTVYRFVAAAVLVLGPAFLALDRPRRIVRMLADDASSTGVLMVVVAIAGAWAKIYADGCRLGWWSYLADVLSFSL